MDEHLVLLLKMPLPHVAQNRWFYGAVAVVLVAILIWALANVSRDTDSQGAADHAQEASKGQRTPSYPPPIGTVEVDGKLPPRDSRSSFAHIQTTVKAVSPFEILENPRKWFEQAAVGNPEAGIATFLLLRSCMKFAPATAAIDVSALAERASQEVGRSNDCSEIPENFAKDTLQWLQPAASKGSFEARLLYASNAEIALRKLSKDANANEARIREISSHAIQYFDEATSYGVIGAFIQLSDAYERGTLAPRNNGLAFAYLQAAADLTGDPELAKRASTLMGRIRQAELEDARSKAVQLVASCCKAPPTPAQSSPANRSGS